MDKEKAHEIALAYAQAVFASKESLQSTNEDAKFFTESYGTAYIKALKLEL